MNTNRVRSGRIIHEHLQGEIRQDHTWTPTGWDQIGSYMNTYRMWDQAGSYMNTHCVKSPRVLTEPGGPSCLCRQGCRPWRSVFTEQRAWSTWQMRHPSGSAWGSTSSPQKQRGASGWACSMSKVSFLLFFTASMGHGSSIQTLKYLWHLSSSC